MMNDSGGAGGVTVRRFDILSPEATGLIVALNTELTRTYPEPGATHFRLDADEVAAGRGAFLIALLSGKPVGCGAVRRVDPRTAEGVRRLVLETGVRQAEAMALYRRAGFRDIPAFGEYVASPLSVCMAKDL